MLGLSLSGGAARAMGHLGVLKVLERENVTPDAIAGCSGGSIVGALYCSGKYNADEMIKIAGEFRWRDFFRPVWPFTGLTSGSVIYDYMHRLIGDLTFEDLDVPLAITATDFETGEKVIVRSGSIARAVQASCSLPVIFPPVKINGRMLIDGGFTSQLPVLVLKDDLKCSKIIAVAVNCDCSKPVESYNNIFRIFYHFLAIPSISCSRFERKYADVVVEVSARDVQLHHYGKTALMIERGVLATESALVHIMAL